MAGHEGWDIEDWNDLVFDTYYVEITPSDPIIELGQTVTLTATGNPGSGLTWYENGSVSRSATILTQNNSTCVVKGTFVGTDNIRVSNMDCSDSTSVTVVNPTGAILVKKINISPSVLNLRKGQTAKVTASISPSNATNKGIVWTVPQGSVASVDQEGNVTAVKDGASRIIAKSVDGNAQAWINVKVSDNQDENPVYAVELDQTSIVVVRGETVTVHAEVIDNDGSDQRGMSIEYSRGNIAWITQLVHSETPTKSTFSVAGLNIGTTIATVRSVTDPSKYAELTIRVVEPGTKIVDRVELSTRDIYLEKDSRTSLEAVVYYTDGTKGIDLTYTFVPTGLVRMTALGGLNYDKTSKIINIFSSSKTGKTLLTVGSEEDPSKYATCLIRVGVSGDDDPDINPPYNPDSDSGEDPIPDIDPGPEPDPEPEPEPIPDVPSGTDIILRIDYEDGEFKSPVTLFTGNLGLSTKHPIESVVYYETEDIQKIYWVDGIHVLRFMNFMADSEERRSWDDTSFDSNRSVSYGVDVKISKDNSGNPRPNGVVQYFLTYYNKHGQESGYVWISDLVYLSPASSGGPADGNNNNSVILELRRLDTRFTHFRIYSVFRSALNGTTTSYIVFEGKTTSNIVTVIDNNSHLTAIDASRLLYLGSQEVVAGTLTHKDETLFLGELLSVGRDYDDLEKTLKAYMVVDGWRSKYITFEYSGEGNTESSIPYDIGDGNYIYDNQLVYSSSQITSFKGGEKYRFALVFHKKDGSMTDAFWIGDAVNTLYPVINDTEIKRVVARCTLPPGVVKLMKANDFRSVQLMIAEATYADRSVKAQGIICPTVFNVWNRYMDRLYASPSWLMRPRNSEYAWKHFEPIHNSLQSTGEIDCNYWSTETDPNPYYQLKNYMSTNKTYYETFDGVENYSHFMIIYRLKCEFGLGTALVNKYGAGATVVLISSKSGQASSYRFNEAVLSKIRKDISRNRKESFTITDGDYSLKIHNYDYWVYDEINYTVPTSISKAYTRIVEAIRADYGFIPADYYVMLSTFNRWCDKVTSSSDDNKLWYFNNKFSSKRYGSIDAALSDDGSYSGDRWYQLVDGSYSSDVNYIPSFYKKHLTFVDENIITLNSPDIEYEAVSFDKADKHKLRIVGVARIDSQYSDYVVEATPGKLSGENLCKEQFENTLIAWPLWKEFGLDPREKDPDDPNTNWTPDPDITKRESLDYEWGGGIVRYWLRMWNHSDKINGFTDIDNNEYSRLIRKVFANARFSGKTVYTDKPNACAYLPDSVRIFNYTSSQYVNIEVGGKSRYYDGIINDSLSVPGSHKYPAIRSFDAPDVSNILVEHDDPAYLYLSDPVSITYSSAPHAVISLPSYEVENVDSIDYEQTILPVLFDSEIIVNATQTGGVTGRLLPWIKNVTDKSYPYKNYRIKQDEFTLPTGTLDAGDQYVYIGELYADMPDDDQIRYGGTSNAAVQNTRFVIAGPQYLASQMSETNNNYIYANQSDTYIQRWDCLKTKPFSSDRVNNVIDITSVMLETHINIDGRTDLQRGIRQIASLDTEKFGSLNHVYSQHNNFVSRHDLDEDFNLDSYASSVTWSLEKKDSAEIDEWSHVTLASVLKLDGDKGSCRALRRFNNSIIAFQDRGISEILFNSRTQLTTTDGVPVEIANSGKVDGKRYITNKYGTTNKWSIIEGKNALYFVDNINKAFCAFNGQAIDNLSTRLGFGAWFREINNTEPWKPVDFNNIVSYYDKVHSDIYLVRNTSDDKPCLVYNETLGAFTSFFDYSAVLMMANVEDRFVSYKNHRMWLQNEGLYCNFFGQQYDYWTQYRVTPEPFSDKIWTNIDYRADFFEVLGSDGSAIVSETDLINGDIGDSYKEWETFTDYKVWDEYQDTGFTPFTHDSFDRDDVRKKFRIWRLAIPRALKEGTNKHGLDRIRNPWINLLFRKSNVDGKYLMQLHDIVVKYFE